MLNFVTIKYTSLLLYFMLVDVHAHLDEVFFGKDIDDMLGRSRKARVAAIIANGVDRNTNRQVLALAERHSIIRPALGIYPMDKLRKETGKDPDFTADEELSFIASKAGGLAALGECGLDFSDSTEEEKKEQERIFMTLIEIAMKEKKPIIVHSRKAEERCIDLLEASGHKKIVMHCFSGKKALVERIRKNRWYFSIPANIVRSEHFQKIVEETPMSQLLTETDAPFLSPYKDQKNEPAFVIETIRIMARIKGITEEEAENLVFMNYQRLF